MYMGTSVPEQLIYKRHLDFLFRARLQSLDRVTMVASWLP